MSNTELQTDSWETHQRILVLLARPDDPEFFCGATTPRWVKFGHKVEYCLVTCGDKGTNDRSIESNILCCTRQIEQQSAIAVLGVERVQFLDYEDGYLFPSAGSPDSKQHASIAQV